MSTMQRVMTGGSENITAAPSAVTRFSLTSLSAPYYTKTMVEHDTTSGAAEDFALAVSGLSKAFGRRRICANITFDLHPGERLAVVGPNGSGKSTFLKMLCGLLRADNGTICYSHGGKKIAGDRWHEHVGLVAPDLALYDELTALENVRFLNDIGGWGKSENELTRLLHSVGLAERGHDLLGTFSSGMKQRLKYAAALIKSPALLLLDEPTTNLDESGVALFHKIIQDQRSAGICVVATNDPQEAGLAERQISMGQ